MNKHHQQQKITNILIKRIIENLNYEFEGQYKTDFVSDVLDDLGENINVNELPDLRDLKEQIKNSKVFQNHIDDALDIILHIFADDLCEELYEREKDNGSKKEKEKFINSLTPSQQKEMRRLYS
jgi:hypothetical protein